jgi:dihydropteroate synthase
VVDEVKAFLTGRIERCLAAGMPRERLLIDPGFGFGKRVEHNLRLLAGLPELAALGYPVLVGLSRKSMIGALLGLEVDERLVPSVALALMAVERGARLVRVHDIAATRHALRLFEAVQAAELVEEN